MESRKTTALPLVSNVVWMNNKRYGHTLRVKGLEVDKLVRVSSVEGDKIAWNSMAMALLGRQRGTPPHEYLECFEVVVCGPSIPVMMSPWHENGYILNYLATHPKASRRMLATQLAQAMVYLHKHEAVHGNLYPGNVLVTDDGNIKVADSFLHTEACIWFREQPPPSTDIPSYLYQAPEVVAPPSSTTATTKAGDVYALASTAFTILSGKEPNRIAPVEDEETSRPGGFEAPQQDVVEALLWDRFLSCWRTDPCDRPIAALVLLGLQHPSRRPAASN